MRAAIAALQFEHPKLGVTVVMNGETLHSRLEKAIERSGQGAKLIEQSPKEQATGAAVKRGPNSQSVDYTPIAEGPSARR